MTSATALTAALAVAATAALATTLTAAPTMAPTTLTVETRTQAQGQREFPDVTELGAALVEYQDGATQVVAAYYYSQRNHDAPWLLIELGVASPRTVRVRRERIEIVTPSGRSVPLAAQRRWGADPARARVLLQQASTTRHQVRSYFRGTRDFESLRFFAGPDARTTVIDDIESGPEQVLLGDLLFESPTGAWERGRHALVITHDRGTVTLPIDLR